MKRIILLIGLGIAFVAVSTWVFISGSRSARAVRTKFRLGGAILTLTSALSMASCERGGFMVSCYDSVMPPHNEVRSEIGIGSELRNGDKVIFYSYCEFESEATVRLLDKDGAELQRESFTMVLGSGSIEFTISVGEYRGDATVVVSYKISADDESEDNLTLPIVIVE